MVEDAVIDQLREAVEALNGGDPAPFASMFADNAEWRGISFGRLWWKHTPSWRGPDEAREVLAVGIKEQRGERITEPEFTKVGADRVIGSALYLGDEPLERYNVLTIRDGKIIDMQGCRSKRDAERYARR